MATEAFYSLEANENAFSAASQAVRTKAWRI
jgi:hypothetical protein